METRRWLELAAAFITALVLGVLIGYGVARSTSPDVPEVRYAVGAIKNEGSNVMHELYRYDVHTGKTWWTYLSPRTRLLKYWHESKWGNFPACLLCVFSILQLS